MGIVQLNKLINCYFHDIECAIPTASQYNLSFDGSLFLFSGCVSQALQVSNNAHDSQINRQYDEEILVQIALKNITEYISKLPNYKNVYFFVDGIKPMNKSYTSSNRIMNKSFNPHNAMSMLLDLIRVHLPFVKICQFKIGESEHEFFLKRDRSLPNILLTNDTDLFHIAYDYLKGSEQDIVYYIQKHNVDVPTNNNNYSFAKIDRPKTLKCFQLGKLNFEKYGIPKVIFSTISFLKGSDYTPSFISPTMADALIAIFLRYNRSGVDNSGINIIIEKLINYGTYFRKFERIRMAKINNDFTPDQLERLDIEGNRIEKIDNATKNFDGNIDGVRVLNDVYDMISVERILTLLMVLLVQIKKESLGKFQWCRSNSIINLTLDDIRSKKINFLQLLTWSLNYSLLGSTFSQYDVPYSWVYRIPQTAIYSYMLYNFTSTYFKETCPLENDNKNQILHFKTIIDNINTQSIIENVNKLPNYN